MLQLSHDKQELLDSSSSSICVKGDVSSLPDSPVVLKEDCLDLKDDSLSLQDYLRFLGMDDESVKDAFVEWLTQLATRYNWLDRDGKPIHRRIAIHFGVSSQTVTNWFDKVGYPSSQMINTVIVPKLGISPAQFWYELQSIDRHLKGIVTLTQEQYDCMESKPKTGEDVLKMIDVLPDKDKQLVIKTLLNTLLEKVS